MASIGALIYKLGLDVSKLVENTKQAGEKIGAMEGLAKKAGVAGPVETWLIEDRALRALEQDNESSG